nr:reverse transcriptase domain-containing protein [Tanacetum cinerariifolium]
MIKSSHGDTPFSLTYEMKAVIPAEIGMLTYRTVTVDIVQNDEELWLNLDLLEEFSNKARGQIWLCHSSVFGWSNLRIREDRPVIRVSVASAPVTTARVTISTVEPRTHPTTTTVFDDDEDLTIAQTLVKIKSEKAKEKGVAFRDEEEPPRLNRSTTTLQPLPTM